MSERPRHANGWPVLEREAPDLPRFEGRQPSLYELLVAYATIAAAFHQRWPQVVDALDWLRTRAENSTPTIRPAAVPDFGEAVERIEEAADRLDEVITGETMIPGPRVDSERVRAIARETAEELAREKDARIAADNRAKASELSSRRWQFWLALFGVVGTGIMTVFAALLVWALTRHLPPGP